MCRFPPAVYVPVHGPATYRLFALTMLSVFLFSFVRRTPGMAAHARLVLLALALYVVDRDISIYSGLSVHSQHLFSSHSSLHGYLCIARLLLFFPCPV